MAVAGRPMQWALAAQGPAANMQKLVVEAQFDHPDSRGDKYQCVVRLALLLLSARSIDIDIAAS